MTYLVQIQAARFRVNDDEIAQVRADIETAVRVGGALIAFEDDGRKVEVLVTPGSSITIARTGDFHQVATDSDVSWHAEAGFDDFALEA